MKSTPFFKAGLLAATVLATSAPAQALPPIETNTRIMGELVAGEVGYQIHKFCPSISARKLRAFGRLQQLASYARSLGYSDADFRAVSKDKAAIARRDARVEAYLAAHGVTKGDSDSYCRLGQEEIQKKTLTGWLLRVN